MSYTLEQFARDKTQAALGAPYAAYRCSQYYFLTVLPACWRSLKLAAYTSQLTNARPLIHYWAARIHKAIVQIWHYFRIAWDNAERLNNHPLLATLATYKEKIKWCERL
jgi:hypothetical protein